jgi:hypothetical protein
VRVRFEGLTAPFHHFPVSLKFANLFPVNRIGGVMVSVLA